MSMPIPGSDPTPYHSSMDCTYIHYQATTTSGSLSFIVHPRVSIIATRTLLPVSRYLDADSIQDTTTTKSSFSVGRYESGYTLRESKTTITSEYIRI